MPRHPSPRQHGFSILEVLITLVVLAAGLLAIGGLYGKIMNGSAAAKERSEAVVLAEQKLEELRYAAYASIASGSDSVNAAIGSGSSANFSRSWSVTSSASPAYKTVAVTVSWTDSRNQSQSAALTSRISGIDPRRSGALIATVSGSSSGTGSGTGTDTGTGTGTDSGTGTDTGTDTGSGTDTGTDPTPAVCTTTLTITTQSANGTIGTDTRGVTCSGAKKQWSCTSTLAYGSAIIITYTANKSSTSWGTTASCTTQTYSSF